MNTPKTHTHPISFWIKDAERQLAKIEAMPRRKWKFQNKKARKMYHACKNGKGYIVDNGIIGVEFNSYYNEVQIVKFC